MIVVDASALVEVLLRKPRAIAVERKVFGGQETLHAPHLVDVEVTQVIRRHLLGGEVDEARAAAALFDLGDLPLLRYPHGALLRRAWELRNNLTVYDGVYVALAEALNATLVTLDRRIAGAPGHNARVDLA